MMQMLRHTGNPQRQIYSWKSHQRNDLLAVESCHRLGDLRVRHLCLHLLHQTSSELVDDAPLKLKGQM